MGVLITPTGAFCGSHSSADSERIPEFECLIGNDPLFRFYSETGVLELSACAVDIKRILKLYEGQYPIGRFRYSISTALLVDVDIRGKAFIEIDCRNVTTVRPLLRERGSFLLSLPDDD